MDNPIKASDPSRIVSTCAVAFLYRYNVSASSYLRKITAIAPADKSESSAPNRNGAAGEI